MTAVTFLDHLFGFIDEIVFPTMAAYVIWLLRNWLQKPRMPS